MKLFSQKNDKVQAVKAADYPPANTWLEEALPEEEIQYEIGGDGNYHSHWTFADGEQTRSACLIKQPVAYRDGTWQKVYSYSFTVDGPLSQKQANALLADSDRHAFGGWCLEEWEGKTAVKYQANLDADDTLSEVRDAIDMVCSVAADMEWELLQFDLR